MILFVEDDGKWKVVNLTHINDFMIAMTTFLKTDKSTRGAGLTEQVLPELFFKSCKTQKTSFPFSSRQTFAPTFQLFPTCLLIPSVGAVIFWAE